MPNCRNCAAPLPAGTLVCSYCHTRVDIDLKGIHEYTVTVPRSARVCPRCDQALQTVDLKLESTFLVERCERCFGLFFDPGELDALLEKSVQHAYQIDYRTIEALAQAKRRDEYSVGYVKCPDCRSLMNRVNFGTRSGVVVDLCGEHGVWLDGGELRQLMEWTKAGGQLLHQQVLERKKVSEEKLARRREQMHRERMAGQTAEGTSVYLASRRQQIASSASDELLGTLARAAFRLFT